MDSEQFLKLGYSYIQPKSKFRNDKFILRKFLSFYGVTPLVCAIAWNQIKHNAPYNAETKHLMWALCFLKQYSTEHIRAALFNTDEKTLRKWTWIFVNLLSGMEIVRSF